MQQSSPPTGTPSEPSGQPIVLIGFMGSGKTSVGRRLAATLDAEFADSDSEIETATGRSITEIFAADGEAAFRALEHTAVLRLLDPAGSDSPGSGSSGLGRRRQVLALGGGAAMHPGTRAALRARAVVVHLWVSLAEALRRVGNDPGRPMLARSDLAELHAVREAACDRLADLVVDVDGVNVDDVTHRVVNQLIALGLVVPEPVGPGPAATGSPPEIGLGDHA